MDDHLEGIAFDESVSSHLVKLSEQIGKISSLSDFLFCLKQHIPKKFKIGEIVLFYESRQFGLRRAYINRRHVFYEEVVKEVWSSDLDIRFSDRQERTYLAQEMGRPFSKTIVLPFTLDDSFSHPKINPILCIELSQLPKKEEQIPEYFYEIQEVLNLILNRLLLNTSASRVSYLWENVFGGWGEPLAILRDDKILTANKPFHQLLKLHTELLNNKHKKDLLNINNQIYQIHYYPIKKIKNLGLFYCQNMTETIDLKEQAFQSEKMEAFYELGRNIAHELNNPLTGVRSMAQILSQNEGLKEFSEELKEVESATARSQKIIDNLLTFSQQKKHQSSFCCLNEVIKGTLPLLKSVTQGVVLNQNISQEKLEVVGDFSILQQVIYNLMLNACQALKSFKEQDSPSVTIDLNIEDREVCLMIKDNGPGIPTDHLEKIFQPLWTTKKEGEGTGLGLGIARQMICRFGGRIEVMSREKEWTCFSVYLVRNGVKNVGKKTSTQDTGS